MTTINAAHTAATEPARVEPSPYDFGLTEDPDMTWAAYRALPEPEAS